MQEYLTTTCEPKEGTSNRASAVDVQTPSRFYRIGVASTLPAHFRPAPYTIYRVDFLETQARSVYVRLGFWKPGKVYSFRVQCAGTRVN
jgi:hypothetical protein